MKRKIQSAELVKYNANSRGKSVGDCVKRSISLAFDDLNYAEASKLLLQEAKDQNKRDLVWNVRSVFGPVIKKLGGKPIAMADHNITVNEFADDIAKSGKAYIVLCGKKWPETSHMVCIRDKKIFDSWDCSEYIVHDYYTIDNQGPLKDLTGIEKKIGEITKEYASPIIKEEIEKYMNKRAWDGHWEFKASRLNYRIAYACSLKLDRDVYITKDRHYSFVINIVFEPTMTEEEAIELAQKTAKVRTYDRMYAIDQQEKKLVEEYKLLAQMGRDKENDYFYVTRQEERFLNSLPGWANAIVKFIDIQNPGMYRNSYQLRIRKLPGDTLHPNDKTFLIEDYDANGIREQLQIYKDTFKIEGIDYTKDW